MYFSKAFVSGLVILNCFHTIMNAGMEDSSARKITGIPHVWRKIYCLPFLLDELLSLKDW